MPLNNSSRAHGPSVMRQVMGICETATGLTLDLSLDACSFRTLVAEKDQDRDGILSVTGRFDEDESLIVLHFGLVKASTSTRVQALPFFRHLASLPDLVRLAPPEENEDGLCSLSAEMSVKVAVLGPARTSALMSKIMSLDEIARLLRQETPAVGARIDKSAALLGDDVADLLVPIDPLAREFGISVSSDWLEEIMAMLDAGMSVGLSAQSDIKIRYAIAALARFAAPLEKKFASLKPPFLESHPFVTLAKSSPATLVAPVDSVAFDSPGRPGANGKKTNQREIRDFLIELGNEKSPVIFIGRPELSTRFRSAAGDQLAVRRVPLVSVRALTRAAIRWEADITDGLSPRMETEMSDRILSGIEDLSGPEQDRVLTIAVRSIVKAWLDGENIAGSWVNKRLGAWLKKAGQQPGARPRSPWAS